MRGINLTKLKLTNKTRKTILKMTSFIKKNQSKSMSNKTLAEFQTIIKMEFYQTMKTASKMTGKDRLPTITLNQKLHCQVMRAAAKMMD